MMKWLDAADVVLRDAGEPLGMRELSDRILARGLLTTRGRTPWETVRSRIQTDINNKGEASRFIKVGPGIFAARAENEQSLPQMPARHVEAGRTAAATRAAGSMSFVGAAEQILRESGSREPLHYEEITRRAIEQGLIQPEGKTPAVSLNAIIGTDIRRCEVRGEQPRFVRHGRGFIGLAEALPPGLAMQIDRHNLEVREQLLQLLREGSPAAFEDLVAELLAALGFEEVERTPLGGDGGIDVRGTLVVGNVVRIRMAVQAKRWKANVQSPTVQQVRGSLGAHEQGLIITTSDFSSGARKEAGRVDASPVALMSGEELADLLAEYEVGVERERHTLLRLLSTGADADSQTQSENTSETESTKA